MADEFANFAVTLTSPLINGEAVTPSDTTNLTTIPRCINVATFGTMRVTLDGDTSPVDLTVSPGILLPLRVQRVWATGTSATGIVALW